MRGHDGLRMASHNLIPAAGDGLRIDDTSSVLFYATDTNYIDTVDIDCRLIHFTLMPMRMTTRHDIRLVGQCLNFRRARRCPGQPHPRLILPPYCAAIPSRAWCFSICRPRRITYAFKRIHTLIFDIGMLRYIRVTLASLAFVINMIYTRLPNYHYYFSRSFPATQILIDSMSYALDIYIEHNSDV